MLTELVVGLHEDGREEGLEGKVGRGATGDPGRSQSFSQRC